MGRNAKRSGPTFSRLFSCGQSGYTSGMEQFHFEQPQEKAPLNLDERREVITSPEDIKGQLETSRVRYEEAFANFRMGDNDEREYLEEMQGNLIAWKNKFDIHFGTLTDENALIENEVLARLAEVSEALEEAEK